jgi:LemA protein
VQKRRLQLLILEYYSGTAAFNKAQSGVSSSLSRLVSAERYPELKANQNFLKLQDELASTENQILTARTRFNEAVNHTTPYQNLPKYLFAGGVFDLKKKHISLQLKALKHQLK